MYLRDYLHHFSICKYTENLAFDHVYQPSSFMHHQDTPIISCTRNSGEEPAKCNSGPDECHALKFSPAEKAAKTR